MTDNQIKNQVEALNELTKEVLILGPASCRKFLMDIGLIEKNKSYKIIHLWPDNKKGFRVGDTLTLYPSGNENENWYGCRIGNNWQWITDPELYPVNLIEIKI